MSQFNFGPAEKQLSDATQSAHGLMSSADKTKLDGVATGATANVVSNSLSDTSTTNALSAAKGKELSEQIGTLMKRVIYTSNNLTISANDYVKVCDYSDLGTGVTYNNIVSVERYSSNMTGTTWFEVYSDGIYVYSALAQTNKWIKLNVVLTSLNIPETIIN